MEFQVNSTKYSIKHGQIHKQSIKAKGSWYNLSISQILVSKKSRLGYTLIKLARVGVIFNRFYMHVHIRKGGGNGSKEERNFF